MKTTQKVEDVLTPFVHLAHIFRSGDIQPVDQALTVCNVLLAKYLPMFKDKQTLTNLLANINAAYKRQDYVSLADIYEYEMTTYLKAEIESFSKNASL